MGLHYQTNLRVAESGSTLRLGEEHLGQGQMAGRKGAQRELPQTPIGVRLVVGVGGEGATTAAQVGTVGLPPLPQALSTVSLEVVGVVL